MQVCDLGSRFDSVQTATFKLDIDMECAINRAFVYTGVAGLLVEKRPPAEGEGVIF